MSQSDSVDMTRLVWGIPIQEWSQWLQIPESPKGAKQKYRGETENGPIDTCPSRTALTWPGSVWGIPIGAPITSRKERPGKCHRLLKKHEFFKDQPWLFLPVKAFVERVVGTVDSQLTAELDGKNSSCSDSEFSANACPQSLSIPKYPSPELTVNLLYCELWTSIPSWCTGTHREHTHTPSKCHVNSTRHHPNVILSSEKLTTIQYYSNSFRPGSHWDTWRTALGPENNLIWHCPGPPNHRSRWKGSEYLQFSSGPYN